MLVRMIATVAVMMAATPVLAGLPVADEVADRYGSTQIMSGQAKRIEPRLAAAYQRGERSPELLINLAAVRMKSHDDGAAQALYRLILTQPNVDMETPSGTAWSHDIARKGLALLSSY